MQHFLAELLVTGVSNRKSNYVWGKKVIGVVEVALRVIPNFDLFHSVDILSLQQRGKQLFRNGCEDRKSRKIAHSRRYTNKAPLHVKLISANIYKYKMQNWRSTGHSSSRTSNP